MSVYCFDNSQN